MKLIGLHGKAGVGKDTFADILVKNHGFVKRGFADPLYEEVAAAFRVSVDWLRDRDRKETPQNNLTDLNCDNPDFRGVMGQHLIPRAMHSPRQILQLWGTEYRRGQDENYWLKQMANFKTFHDITEPTDPARPVNGIVIPDCRFENEAEWVRRQGGYILKIERNVPNVAAHVSEAELPARLVDRTVHNYGPLHHLEFVANSVAYFATHA